MTRFAFPARRSWKGRVTAVAIATGVVVAAILILAVARAPAASPARSSSSYTVPSTSVPGVDTGLVLKNASVTATGTVCVYATSSCVGPDGSAAVDTTQSGFGGFPAPGAPAWGLVGRIGAGPWIQVGSGPTTLSGSGDLEFAVNDDYLADNTGDFTVTVSYSRRSVSGTSSCWPGWGYGDDNHGHTGPPPRDPQACYPGHGYGDTNHRHEGPPGQQTSGQSSTNTSHPSSSDHKSPPGKHR